MFEENTAVLGKGLLRVTRARNGVQIVVTNLVDHASYATLSREEVKGLIETLENILKPSKLAKDYPPGSVAYHAQDGPCFCVSGGEWVKLQNNEFCPPSEIRRKGLPEGHDYDIVRGKE